MNLCYILRVFKTIYNFIQYNKYNAINYIYSSPPTLSVGDPFQDPQWMPETTDYTKPHIPYVFSCTEISMIIFKRVSSLWCYILDVNEKTDAKSLTKHTV